MDEKKRRNTGMSTILLHVQHNRPDSLLAAIIEKELKLAYERGYRAGVRTEVVRD
jgi:hypothetical protein